MYGGGHSRCARRSIRHGMSVVVDGFHFVIDHVINRHFGPHKRSRNVFDQLRVLIQPAQELLVRDAGGHRVRVSSNVRGVDPRRLPEMVVVSIDVFGIDAPLRSNHHTIGSFRTAWVESARYGMIDRMPPAVPTMWARPYTYRFNFTLTIETRAKVGYLHLGMMIRYTLL